MLNYDSSKKETIPSGIEDDSYRYVMSKMILKEIIRGNSKYTQITNIDEVANTLRVPPMAIMKWMQSELGAKVADNSVINGYFSYDTLLKLLDKFILKYVVCATCLYPELTMSADGKKGLKSVCNSCGNTEKHDAGHRAGKVILKAIKDNGEPIPIENEKDNFEVAIGKL